MGYLLSAAAYTLVSFCHLVSSKILVSFFFFSTQVLQSNVITPFPFYHYLIAYKFVMWPCILHGQLGSTKKATRIHNKNQIERERTERKCNSGYLANDYLPRIYYVLFLYRSVLRYLAYATSPSRPASLCEKEWEKRANLIRKIQFRMTLEYQRGERSCYSRGGKI